MARATLNKLLLVGTLGLFVLNFTPVMAQVMQIEVHGGGYRMEGPCLLVFPSVSASFGGQTTNLDSRDITGDCDPGPSTITNPSYFKITDENGGRPFSVMISSSNFTASPSGNIIPVSNFLIQNKDDNITTNNIDTINGSANGVTLNADTNTFASLDIQRTLLNGTGSAPGIWKIYPLFRINIPAAIPPGLYTTTITFDVF